MMVRYELRKVKAENPSIFKIKGFVKAWIEVDHLFINYKDCLGDSKTIKFKIDSMMGLKHVN